MFVRTVRSVLVAALLPVMASMVSADEPGESKAGDDLADAARDEITWHGSYAEACSVAKAANKMLLVYFHQVGFPRCDQLESVALADPAVYQQINERFVALRVSVDATIAIEGKQVQLLDHESFSELRNKPGIAIVDYAHPGTEHFGYVVSVYPLVDGKFYRFRPEHLSLLLDLPPGTLSQRTMVFAVRTHPENPESTLGNPSDTLMEAAESHSRHQANITVQGHHNWSSRFHQIGSRLPGGLSAQEVVAESWPNQGLLDSCIDCVQSWRQSSGHWGAVRRRQPMFGYDIKRGRNGIWYATGIFGNRN